MGYDMRWVRANPGEAEEVAALRAEFYAAITARDRLPRGSESFTAAQDQVDAALEAMSKAEASYFRLNIHGMGKWRHMMETLGMAFEDDPHPPFPKAEDHGTNWEDVEAVDYPEDHEGYQWTDERLRAALGYREAVNAVLAFHGKADTPGIPLHKFGSNDGWLVLPVECEAAVRIWREFVATEGEEAALNFVGNKLGEGSANYWLEWIKYLAGAVRHDGFEVH